MPRTEEKYYILNGVPLTESLVTDDDGKVIAAGNPAPAGTSYINHGQYQSALNAYNRTQDEDREERDKAQRDGDIALLSLRQSGASKLVAAGLVTTEEASAMFQLGESGTVFKVKRG